MGGSSARAGEACRGLRTSDARGHRVVLAFGVAVPGFCFGEFSRFGEQQRTETSSAGDGFATLLSLVMNEGSRATCLWRRAMIGLLGSGVIGAMATIGT